jgi:hypothetical protein
MFVAFEKYYVFYVHNTEVPHLVRLLHFKRMGAIFLEGWCLRFLFFWDVARCHWVIET